MVLIRQPWKFLSSLILLFGLFPQERITSDPHLMAQPA
jgi:hypothetical protein